MKTLIVFLLAIGYAFGQDENLEVINWKDDRKLNWSDFKAMPDPNSDAVALTASGLTFLFSIETAEGVPSKLETTVVCSFYPEKSWYKKSRANDYILRHEQMHFNITELHARKFRQQIEQLTLSRDIKSKLGDLYSSINQAMGEMQNRYDIETKHSINKTKQQEWEAYIISELKQLESYKSN